MKKLGLFVCFSLLCACAAGIRGTLPAPNAADMPFTAHIGPGAFDNVLAQNLPYENFKKLRFLLEKHFGRPLRFYQGWNKNGEAHITVITPVEYWQVLRSYLSMEEINQIARRHHIQNQPAELLGMGTGRLQINGKEEETYFVIVRAPGLTEIRRAIAREFIKRGGRAEDFDPEEFYPHITVAYTLRDLHIQDGVKKDLAHSRRPDLDGLRRQAFAD